MRFETSENFATGVMIHFSDTERMISSLNVSKGKSLLSPPSPKEPYFRDSRGCDVLCEYGKLILRGSFHNIIPSKLRETMDVMRNFVLEELRNKRNCHPGKGYEDISEFRIWFDVNVNNMCLELSFYMEAIPEQAPRLAR